MLLEQMIVLFLVMCAGYYCSKKHMITENVNKDLSAIIVNIANPALILTAGISEDKVERTEMLFMCGIAVIVFAFLMGLAAFLPELLGIAENRRGTYRLMTVFGNIGFMGFPILSAIYGDSSVLYASVFVVIFNILIYTYGIAIMQRKKTGDRHVQTQTLNVFENAKRILNVGVISCMIALILYLSDWQVPSFVQRTARLLGDMTGPVSMMVIGISLSTMELKTLFTDMKLVLFVLIRLLAVPAIGMLFVNCFVEQEIMRGVCMVMLATPVASMTTMLARQYDGDYELTARGIALSTILCVVTMPLIQMLFL